MSIDLPLVASAFCYNSRVMVREFIPDTVEYPNTAIVMSNGFAGSVERSFGLAAQEIAQLSGALVLAYDRVGTGNRTVFSLHLRNQLRPNRVVQRAASTGQVIAARMDPAIQNVVSFGHSGASTEAIALTLSETLPVVGLGLSEPVGIQKVHPVRGMAKELWYDYKNERPERRAQPPETPKVKEAETARHQKIGKTALEIFYYSALWPTTFGLDGLQKIGRDNPDIAVYVAFANPSLNGDEKLIESIVDRMSRFRHLTLNKPMKAETWPGTLHSAFDKPAIATKVIRRTIELAGLSPR